MVTRTSFLISVQNNDNKSTIKRQLEEETSDVKENLGNGGKKQTIEKVRANKENRQTKSKQSTAKNGEKDSKFVSASNFRRRGRVSLKKESDGQEYVHVIYTNEPKLIKNGEKL